MMTGSPDVDDVDVVVPLVVVMVLLRVDIVEVSAKVVDLVSPVVVVDFVTVTSEGVVVTNKL